MKSGTETLCSRLFWTRWVWDHWSLVFQTQRSSSMCCHRRKWMTWWCTGSYLLPLNHCKPGLTETFRWASGGSHYSVTTRWCCANKAVYYTFLFYVVKTQTSLIVHVHKLGVPAITPSNALWPFWCILQPYCRGDTERTEAKVNEWLVWSDGVCVSVKGGLWGCRQCARVNY